MSASKCLHLNYVPDDWRFASAAIDFVVNHRGCGKGQLPGDAVDALTFLENYQHGDLAEWPEFLDFCERQGLPVSRAPFCGVL